MAFPYAELLIGSGSGASRRKRAWLDPARSDWEHLIALDHNPDHCPDIEWDLENLPLPIADESFDEIHAYHVMEHVGKLGDWRFFFDQWADFWRILRPGGLFVLISPAPNTVWVWGDPSHTRVIQPEQFVFLDQSEYAKQVGVTQMSDFRFYYTADFERVVLETSGNDELFVILRAVKPSRIAR